MDGFKIMPNRPRRFSVSGKPATAVARELIALFKFLQLTDSNTVPALIALMHAPYSFGSFQ